MLVVTNWKGLPVASGIVIESATIKTNRGAKRKEVEE
jgi:hypothetical protein